MSCCCGASKTWGAQAKGLHADWCDDSPMYKKFSLKKLVEALEAGNYNAAPSQLTQGGCGFFPVGPKCDGAGCQNVADMVVDFAQTPFMPASKAYYCDTCLPPHSILGFLTFSPLGSTCTRLP